MAELRATPQSPGWAWLAEKLGATRRALDEAFPLAPGSFLLQGAPEEVREWSYGNYPLRLQHPYAGRTASRMPSVQPGRGQALADTALLAAELTPVVGPLARVARSTAASVQSTPPLGVIKAPGGNWLAGQVERALNETKNLTAGLVGKTPESVLAEMKATYPPEVVNTLSPESFALVNRAFADLEPKVALNKWIDSKLTKYIKNEMATERDPLRLQADRWATEQQPKLLAEKQKQIDKARADMERAQRERGVDPEMLTRSRAWILELEKERDFIAARKGLHVDPENLTYGRHTVHPSGEVLERRGVSPTARQWETAADYAITPGQARTYLETRNADTGVPTVERNPWLLKVPPETPVYDLSVRGSEPSDLGFDHLIDELKNAMDPASALPRSLRIDVKDIDKLTVPQVADLVDRIDAYRAVQKAEADKLAAQKSIVVHKEYPESEQGLRWVEMKLITPEQLDLPKGYEIVEDPSRNQAGEIIKMGYRVKTPEGKMRSYGETPAQAYAQHFGKKDLEEALKYEGDIMQHCVGGYCPDVVEGRSRIFSLRDSKGEPHVTIEVNPMSRDEFIKDNYVSYRDMLQEGRDFADRWVDQQLKNLFPKIAQIKGKANRAPKEEYLPFVQDFVRSGKWSDVKDMEHTGLIDLRDTRRALDALGTRDLGELKRLKETIKRDYVTPEELSQFRSTSGYAAGGAVRGYDPSAIERIVQDFETNPPRYAAGGVVRYDPAHVQGVIDRFDEEFTA